MENTFQGQDLLKCSHAHLGPWSSETSNIVIIGPLTLDFRRNDLLKFLYNNYYDVQYSIQIMYNSTPYLKIYLTFEHQVKLLLDQKAIYIGRHKLDILSQDRLMAHQVTQPSVGSNQNRHPASKSDKKIFVYGIKRWMTPGYLKKLLSREGIVVKKVHMFDASLHRSYCFVSCASEAQAQELVSRGALKTAEFSLSFAHAKGRCAIGAQATDLEEACGITARHHRSAASESNEEGEEWKWNGLELDDRMTEKENEEHLLKETKDIHVDVTQHIVTTYTITHRNGITVQQTVDESNQWNFSV